MRRVSGSYAARTSSMRFFSSSLSSNVSPSLVTQTSFLPSYSCSAQPQIRVGSYALRLCVCSSRTCQPHLCHAHKLPTKHAIKA